MDTASEVLVIIVSSILSLFLILGIVILVKVLQIVGDLKRITKKAEKLADSAEAIGDYFQRAAKPAAVMSLLSNITETVFHHEKKNKRGE